MLRDLDVLTAAAWAFDCCPAAIAGIDSQEDLNAIAARAQDVLRRHEIILGEQPCCRAAM